MVMRRFINPGQSVSGLGADIKPPCYRRTPVSMSSPAGTITPLGESLASSFCGSLTPRAISPSGEGGFETGFMPSRGPAVIQDHIRSRPPQIQPACLCLSHSSSPARIISRQRESEESQQQHDGLRRPLRAITRRNCFGYLNCIVMPCSLVLPHKYFNISSKIF